jgi:zinc transport system substrate-binding protein
VLKRIISGFLSIGVLLLLFSCSVNEEGKRSDIVLVTLAPYKFFVEQIAGDTVEVKLVVPTGASPHSYEPTARQILDASKADIWFLIGESFEERAVQALTSYKTDLKTIDMRSGIELIEEREPGHEHCHHHGCDDPHIWMSPELVKKQGRTITETLIEKYPERALLYTENLRKFEEKLNELDKQISTILESMKNRTILVSHPAYAYFCKDYGLKQISIEFEGKDPSPNQLTKILQRARKNMSPFVYIQVQNPSKGAKLVAEEIGARIVDLDPYGENYFENMIHISKSFAAQ